MQVLQFMSLSYPGLPKLFSTKRLELFWQFQVKQSHICVTLVTGTTAPYLSSWYCKRANIAVQELFKDFNWDYTNEIYQTKCSIWLLLVAYCSMYICKAKRPHTKPYLLNNIKNCKWFGDACKVPRFWISLHWLGSRLCN